FFFSSRRRHTRFSRDWSSDVCSSDLLMLACIGLRLGLDPAVGGQLGRLGVHAAVFAVATAGGAVGAGILAAGGMALVRRRLAREDRKSGGEGKRVDRGGGGVRHRRKT